MVTLIGVGEVPVSVVYGTCRGSLIPHWTSRHGRRGGGFGHLGDTVRVGGSRTLGGTGRWGELVFVTTW